MTLVKIPEQFTQYRIRNYSVANSAVSYWRSCQGRPVFKVALTSAGVAVQWPRYNACVHPSSSPHLFLCASFLIFFLSSFVHTFNSLLRSLFFYSVHYNIVSWSLYSSLANFSLISSSHFSPVIDLFFTFIYFLVFGCSFILFFVSLPISIIWFLKVSYIWNFFVIWSTAFSFSSFLFTYHLFFIFTSTFIPLSTNFSFLFVVVFHYGSVVISNEPILILSAFLLSQHLLFKTTFLYSILRNLHL